MKQNKKTLSLKTLNKSNVWEIQENDVFRLWNQAQRDIDLKDNIRKYTDIIRSAFNLEEIKSDNPKVAKSYEERGYQVGKVKLSDSSNLLWAIKKRPVQRVTDLNYDNIRHISAAKLIEILGRNFGGGWSSLSQSIQDIIESGFDISTTTLPADRLHRKGGMYEKKIADGYEALEIPQGSWTEVIFAKEKPKTQTPKFSSALDPDLNDRQKHLDEDGHDDSDDSDSEDEPDVYEHEEAEDEDDFDEDRLTEESYRTTYESEPEDLNLEAEDMSDEDDY